jgi:hypothetical protein
MAQIVWLALGYNVPAHPSKNRVYVWRKLKEFGAGYFKQGVAILPKSAAGMAKFRLLAAKIRDMGGDATIAELKFVDAIDEARTVSWFENQSEEEYLELLRDCADVVGKVGRLPTGREDYMKKLGKRYTKVRDRDFFGSRRHGEVTRQLDELLGDMANVTDELRAQLAKMFN